MRPVRRRISSRDKYFSACDPSPCSPLQSRHRCFANSPNRWSCRVRCSSPGRMTEPSRRCWFLAEAVMEALLNCLRPPDRCRDYSGQRHFPDRPARCRRRLVPRRPPRHWASRRRFPCCRRRLRRRCRPCLAQTIRQARSKWRSWRSRQLHVLFSSQPPFSLLTAAHSALFRNKCDWAGWTKHPRYAGAEYSCIN